MGAQVRSGVDISLADYLQQLKTDDWLTPRFEASFTPTPEGWSDTPSTFVRPSSSGNSCAREIQLSVLGHRTETSVWSQRRMQNGTATHVRVTDWFRDAGLVDQGDLRLTVFADGHQVEGDFSWDERKRLIAEHGIIVFSGETDLVVQRDETSKITLGEIKSMNEWRWKGIPSQHDDWNTMGAILEQKEQSYTRQLANYVIAFQRYGYDVSDDAFFYLENTNTQDYKIRWFRVNDRIRTLATEQGESAMTATAAGELLDPPFPRTSQTCRRCYRELLCYAIQDGEEETCQRVKKALVQAAQQLA